MSYSEVNYWTKGRQRAVVLDGISVLIGLSAFAMVGVPATLLGGTIYTLSVLGLTHGGLKLSLDLLLPESDRKRVSQEWGWISPVGRSFGAATYLITSDIYQSRNVANHANYASKVLTGGIGLVRNENLISAFSLGKSLGDWASYEFSDTPFRDEIFNEIMLEIDQIEMNLMRDRFRNGLSENTVANSEGHPELP